MERLYCNALLQAVVQRNSKDSKDKVIQYATLPADLFGVIGHFTFKIAPGEVGV